MGMSAAFSRGATNGSIMRGGGEQDLTLKA